MQNIKVVGNYEIKENQDGTYWARSLPYSEDLKHFETKEEAAKYANAHRENNQGNK